MLKASKNVLFAISLVWLLNIQTCLSQCNSCILTLQQKGTCNGGSLNLEAKTNGKFEGWTDSTGLLLDTSKYITVKPIYTTSYTAFSKFSNVNLILNGDFELGNQGFQSDYNFTNSTFKNSSYTVNSNPADYLSAYVNQKDKTSGSGKMLIVDGNTDSTKIAYKTIIPVNKNEKYEASFWVSNIHKEFAKQTPDTSQQKIPIIQVFIDGILQTTYFLPLDTVWHQISVTWIANKYDNIKFEVNTRSTSVKGNDFAIDEVKFSSTYTKTATISLQPCNYEPIVSPDGDGQYDTYFISETGMAKIIDLDGNVINEISTPANWDGTKKSGGIANAGYYAIVVNNKVFRVSLIR